MREDLDEGLCRDFPLLYRDLCWGFPGDGWEPIIRRLSEKLEAAIVALPECRAAQVKEKFGILRFYMTSSTDEMEQWIREAERESARTCEDCGAPGVRTGKGWIRTLCGECSV